MKTVVLAAAIATFATGAFAYGCGMETTAQTPKVEQPKPIIGS